VSISDPELPARPGSYLLWLYLPRRTRIAVGRLGERIFPRGWYGYCGSACGPGGLRARLGHHLGATQRPHRHIDYLRGHARPKYIWLTPEPHAEHRWATRLATCPEARQPCRLRRERLPLLQPSGLLAACSPADRFAPAIRRC